MPKPSKIETLGLQRRVFELRNHDKDNVMSYKDIAVTLSKESGNKISHMAVKRFLDNYENEEQAKAIEVIKEDKRRVVKSVNQNYDIIQSQLDISNRVLEKLDGIQDIDSIIEKVSESAKVLMNHGMRISPEDFGGQLAKQISDNIKDFTTLTREVRENNKFLADLQSKIYDFSLLQEFVTIFISEFEEEDPAITERVLKRIAGNPRMKWLAEEQNRIRGG